MKLVIVESPAKAKTLSKFLDRNYKIMASIGHICELAVPKQIPKKDKEKYGKFGIDIDNGFKPYYRVSNDKKKVISELKNSLKNAGELYLATDEDREGEAISKHLIDVLKPNIPVKRMVFHEITKDAIINSLKNIRDIDDSLVNSQETRRILDRLFGYELSPVLWKKIRYGLSAGRVQSPAVRLIVDKELERMDFIKASYYGIDAIFSSKNNNKIIIEEKIDKNTVQEYELMAVLKKVNAQNIATGNDFNKNGKLEKPALILDKKIAENLVNELKKDEFNIENIKTKPWTRKTPSPFITSTLQQDAFRKLHFSSKQTMALAQRLYEKGLITYMRTDSTFLSNQAINACRDYIINKFGKSYLPANKKTYITKSANAQEAHEAIRPAGNSFANPENISIGDNEKKLYTLIFNRTIASQMEDAKGETITTLINGKKTNTVFSASGSIVTFEGFYKILRTNYNSTYNKNFKNNTQIFMEKIATIHHETLPPARYNQGSLIAKLEELGIGRPSTYASIMSTIFDREYVYNIDNAIAPTWLGFGIIQLLKNYFPSLIEYDFTAEMEEDLDKISNGDINYKLWLNWFYFGKDKFIGLKRMVENYDEKIDFELVNTIKLNNKIDVRVGKTHPYMIVHENDKDITVSIPENVPPDELQNIDTSKLIVKNESLGKDLKTGGNIFLKVGRFGPYITLLDEDEEQIKNESGKAINISLLKSMNVDTFNYDNALKLLQLPRKVGIYNNNEITAQNGRYGPYLKAGSKMISLDSEEEMFTISEDNAIKKLNDPKVSNNYELGIEKETGKTISKKRGFYGPYITDGTVNVSVKGNENITFEEALEKIIIKRKNPNKKKFIRKNRSKKNKK